MGIRGSTSGVSKLRGTSVGEERGVQGLEFQVAKLEFRGCGKGGLSFESSARRI